MPVPIESLRENTLKLYSLLVRGALSLAALSAGSITLAGQQTYFGQDISKFLGLVNAPAAEAAFLASLSSYGTETLEGIPAFTPDPMLSFPPLGITAQSDFDFVAGFAPLAVSGANLLLDAGPATADGDPIPDVLLFSRPVTAFGTYISNAGDANTANTITFVLENTLLGTSKSVSLGPLGPGALQDNVLYFGVTDTDPFDKVTMHESFDFDGVLLDNITVGFVIPEPESLVLGLGGTAALLAAARRRR